MFVGNLVRHENMGEHLGIVVARKAFPTVGVRYQVEWIPSHMARGLWINSTALERLDSDDINILRGSC